MGKRNLATVGTHRDFYADMLDERTGTDPSLVSGCASPEDAATSYFRNVFENSGGLIRSAVVTVWPASGSRNGQTSFDMNAEVTPCAEPDADPDEFDVVIEVRHRS